ncbi:MAG: AAA family ATPase [Clostridium sp.]|uniref:AAA family ATPase n=1 Tax=Clostridium sp. TaxID=1506 RepID=UPI002A75410D|nr:AAA family ATPase [Clostridium sp.]MDY2631704.1 AAA family ATPase [Clostridium sp.]MDY6228540.1 AAA family ATPase [Clostridium sp.]
MKLLYIESTENIFNFFGETNLQLNIDIESSQLEVGEKIIIIFKSNDSFYINTIIEVVEILEDKLIVKKCLEVGKNIEYKSERLHIKIPELDDISDNKSKEIISKMIEDFNNFQNTESKEDSIKRNRIVFGAPGTGKSYLLDNDRKIFGSNFERITFHPNYTYSQFVGSYKPVSKLNKAKCEKEVGYEFVPGPFLKVLIDSLKDEKEGTEHLLIIEEINRANPAAVFGDIFQLLDRDKNGKSCYKVTVSKEMKEFLQSEDGLGNRFDEILGEDSEQIYIPNNMYIWATMNSADQGVYPMDSAFKRRWSFEYIGINYNEDLLEEKEYNIIQLKNGKDTYETYKWNDIRKSINSVLKGKVNEDKLLGPYFLSESELKKGNIGNEAFDNIFKSKVLMYLYEDILKHKKNIRFFGKDVHSLSDVMDAYDEGKAFCFNIESQEDKHSIEEGNGANIESLEMKDMELADELSQYNE